MVSVKKELNTVYITADFLDDFTSLCKRSLGQTVDLADCRFAPPTARVLREYYKTIEFINSTDAYWNSILVNNTKLARAEKKESITLEYLGIDASKVVNYIESLKTDTIYRIEYDSTSVTQQKYFISLAIIIILSRPEIMLDLGYNAKLVFETVRLDWDWANQPTDYYNEVVSDAVVQRLCRDGKVITPYGAIKERFYVENKLYLSLPGYFGSEVCVRRPEFKAVLKAAVGTFTEKLQIQRSLVDYLEEEYND